MKSGNKFSLKRKRRTVLTKKGAINLSVEFLVVIILSIVLLGMGVFFLYSLLGQAEELKEDLDQRTEDELQRLLIDQGKRVALPLHTADVLAGERHVFGIGILNVDVAEPNNDFTLSIEKVTGFDPAKNPLSAAENALTWLLYQKDPLTIELQEHRTEPILVAVPKDAAKGTYIFEVVVKKSDSVRSQYGNTQT
ncbi:hypothetical protein HYX13_00460, partial [Candidatus Woesearchaeota archaeon]|nr:hypothetical protein [Candidatus Woesearchaeota archaeon]